MSRSLSSSDWTSLLQVILCACTVSASPVFAATPIEEHRGNRTVTQAFTTDLTKLSDAGRETLSDSSSIDGECTAIEATDVAPTDSGPSATPRKKVEDHRCEITWNSANPSSVDSHSPSSAIPAGELEESLAESDSGTGTTESESSESGESSQPDVGNNMPAPLLSDPQDPTNLMREIDSRGPERAALIMKSPLSDLAAITSDLSDKLYEATGMRFGISANFAAQALTDVLPGEPDSGSAIDTDYILTWELINRGLPTVGKIYAHGEARWDFSELGPQNLGFVALGSAIGTANAFSGYDPPMILRNLYWQQGGPEAGWFYRIGRITPDATLATSKYLSPVTTFLSNAQTGFFANAYPDSGYGAVAGVSLNERLALIGLVSDANADRFTDGDISAGRFFSAAEIAFKQWPRTENAGYSKITFWNHPGDSKAINASTGNSGWGMSIKLEQELTSDGRLIGIARWAKALKGKPAIWDQQAGLALIFNEPRLLGILKDDAIGFGFNWVKENEDARDEYDIELFYRFPLFQNVDLTLAYQYVIDPANARSVSTGRYIVDDSSVFTLRVRATF